MVEDINDSQDIKDQTIVPESATPKQKKAIVISILASFLIGFCIVYSFMPELTQQESKAMSHFPGNIQELRVLHKSLVHISEKHSIYVYFLFCYTYTLLASLGLPGAGPLAMLAGSLFGGLKAFTICCLVAPCSTLGGCFCYWLTDTIGRNIVMKLFAGRIKYFQKQLDKNKENLFWFMLFVRISPIIPKWFVNLSSSIVGMPFKTYAIGTLLGYIPGTIIIVRMGLTLYEIDKLGMNTESFLTLLVLGFAVLIPIKLRKSLEKKINPAGNLSPNAPKLD